MSEPEIVYSPEAMIAMAKLGGNKDWTRTCTACKRTVQSCRGGGWRITCPTCGFKERMESRRPRTTSTFITNIHDGSGCTKKHPMENRLSRSPEEWADRDDT